MKKLFAFWKKKNGNGDELSACGATKYRNGDEFNAPGDKKSGNGDEFNACGAVKYRNGDE